MSKEPLQVHVSKTENAILKSSAEITEAISKHPDCNTYMPLSAGIESTAALSAAILSFLPINFDAPIAAFSVALVNSFKNVSVTI